MAYYLRQPIALFDTEQTRINTKLAFIDSARFEENACFFNFLQSIVDKMEEVIRHSMLGANFN